LSTQILQQIDLKVNIFPKILATASLKANLLASSLKARLNRQAGSRRHYTKGIGYLYLRLGVCLKVCRSANSKGRYYIALHHARQSE
jgi:hypothetical protein